VVPSETSGAAAGTTKMRLKITQTLTWDDDDPPLGLFAAV